MKNSLLVLSFIFSVMIVMLINADGEKKRIETKQVNIRNYEQFIDQLKQDLPTGTSFDTVDSYLKDLGVEYGYYDNEKSFSIMIPSIDRSWFIFKTDLWIKIHVSDNKKDVVRIEGNLLNTGP